MTKILHRKFASMLVITVLALFGTFSVHAQHAPAKNKVIVQVSEDEPRIWALALNNVRNLQEGVGINNIDIEIVAFGPGIAMLKSGSAVGSRIADAIKSGVKVAACENAMRGNKLVQADMLPNLGYVPSGVVELMKKQQEGWAYLRP